MGARYRTLITMLEKLPIHYGCAFNESQRVFPIDARTNPRGS